MKFWGPLLVGTITFASAERADACGGLFCSQISPTPVDQASERIIFEVNDDLSVTATVEIKYQGNPQDFSWIVPVSGTPDFVDVAGKDELQLLDLATAPTFRPPTVNGCGGGGFGFNGCANEALASPSDGGRGEEVGVNVTAYPSVGPFDDIVVVEGGNPDALIAWLRDNDYQVTDGMRPFIEDYTLEGYKFLATRLRADAEVQDMVPIRFHCPQPNPEIPLRLTAIAAEPQMGFLVFVIGPRRYTTLNYAEVALNTADIHLDQFNQNNYFALVSKRIDDEGGLGFVVERAQPASVIASNLGNVFLNSDQESQESQAASRATLLATLGEDRYVTRFYGRMDPDEMLADPIFVARPDDDTAGDVDGILDLSGQVSENCSAPVMPVCGGLYCGAGDACSGSELGDGCVCRNGHVARSINAPGGGVQVVCSSLEVNLHGAGTDACSGAACGLGTCIPLNDRPSCVCDEGAVAVIDRGLVTCVAQDGPVYESDQLSWPPFVDDTGCAASKRDVGGSVSLALLFGSALVLRLRRRSLQP